MPIRRTGGTQIPAHIPTTGDVTTNKTSSPTHAPVAKPTTTDIRDPHLTPQAEAPKPPASFWGRLRDASKNFKTYAECKRTSERHGFGGATGSHEQDLGKKSKGDVKFDYDKDGNLTAKGKVTTQVDDKTNVKTDVNYDKGKVSVNTNVDTQLNDDTKLKGNVGYKDGKVTVNSSVDTKLNDDTNVKGDVSVEDGKVTVNSSVDTKLDDDTKLKGDVSVKDGKVTVNSSVDKQIDDKTHVKSDVKYDNGKVSVNADVDTKLNDDTKLNNKVGIKDGKITVDSSVDTKLNDKTNVKSNVKFDNGKVSVNADVDTKLNDDTKLNNKIGIKDGKVTINSSVDTKLDDKTNVKSDVKFDNGKVSVNADFGTQLNDDTKLNNKIGIKDGKVTVNSSVDTQIDDKTHLKSNIGFGDKGFSIDTNTTHKVNDDLDVTSNLGFVGGKFHLGATSKHKVNDKTNINSTLGYKDGDLSFGSKTTHKFDDKTDMDSSIGFAKGRFNLGAHARHKVDPDTDIGGGLIYKDGDVDLQGTMARRYKDGSRSELRIGGDKGSLTHTHATASADKKWGSEYHWTKETENGVTTETTNRIGYHRTEKVEDKVVKKTGQPIIPEGTTKKENWADTFTIPLDIALAQVTEGIDARAGIEYASKSGTKVTKRVGAAGIGRVYSEAGASIMGNARITTKGVDATIATDARLHLLGAEGELIVASPQKEIAGELVDLHVKVTGRAFVGADARPYARVALSPWPPKATVEGQAGAFVGARTTAEVELGAGKIFTFRAIGEGWIGAGIEGDFVASYEKGKIKLGLGGGLALKVGGKIGGQVEVDVLKLARMAKEAGDIDNDDRLTLNDPATLTARGIDGVGTIVESSADGIIGALDADKNGRFSLLDLQMRSVQAADAVGDVLDDGVDAIGDGLQAVGRGIDRGIDAIEDGVDATGRAIGRGFNAVGDAIEDGVDAVGDGLQAVGRGIDRGIDAIEDGVEVVGDAIEDGVDAIGGAIRSLGNAKSRGQLGQQLRQGARNVARRAHDTADLNNDGRLSARDLMFGARYVGDAVVDTAEDVVEAVDKGRDITADPIVDGSDALAHGVQDVGGLWLLRYTCICKGQNETR